MSRRRRTDLWDDLFEILRWLFSVVHPAWCIPVAMAVFFIPVIWFQRAINIPSVQMLGALLSALAAIVSLAAGVAGWKLRQQRVAFLRQHLDIDWLNRLSWQDFERQVAEVHRHHGYRVAETGGGGPDGGVDLRLQRDGMTSIVQCKRWKTYQVGVKPVRELFGVMAAEKADRAIFITSGICTDEAVRFAQGKPIELVDGAQLAEMLRRVQSMMKQASAPSESTTSMPTQISLPDTAPARPKFPRCGSDMVLRRARTGQHAGREFWGCSTFAETKCAGIRDVELR
ncbi:MAG: restriction endonuclease [Verrucomicrobiota bacterium]